MQPHRAAKVLLDLELMLRPVAVVTCEQRDQDLGTRVSWTAWAPPQAMLSTTGEIQMASNPMPVM
jgi:hypothetical protein